MKNKKIMIKEKIEENGSDINGIGKILSKMLGNMLQRKVKFESRTMKENILENMEISTSPGGICLTVYFKKMKSSITSIIKNKCKNIKIILTDVDGVLTDGGRYYSEKGETLKKFHVRDGMGVNILLRNGIKTIIVHQGKFKNNKKMG